MLFDKRNRNSDEPLSTEESRELKTVAGQLSWVASQTRLDLSFDALELNIMKNKLTMEQVSRANKAIRMLNPIQARLFLPFKGPRGGGSLGTPLMISGTIKARVIKLCTRIVLLKAYQNTKRNFKILKLDLVSR